MMVQLCCFQLGVLEMNDKEHHASTYGFSTVNRLVPDSMENPLWVGNVSVEEGDMVSQHALRAETHSASPNNGDFSASQFPVADTSQVSDGQL